jgi:Tol biopolymer transport system component
MTEHETGPMDDYGRRIGREMYALGTRALRPFDAAGIAHRVATGHRRAAHPFALGRIATRRPGRLLLVIVLLGMTLMLALWAVVGRQPSSPLRFAPGSIAFSRDGDLYVASADGSGEVQVAPGDVDGGQIHPFAFAPSRRALAYSGDGPLGAELVLSAPDGRTLGSRAFDDPNTATWFSWAPEGDQLVISQTADRPELAIVGLDGHVMRTLALPEGFTWGWLPDLGSWSPDGRWIAVLGCIQPCDIKDDPTVMLVAADGSGWQWLTSAPAKLGYLVREAWAPDGRLVLGNSGPGVTIAPPGWTQRPISLPGRGPWSPDGSQMAVAGNGIAIVGPDGTTRLVRIDRAPISPTPGNDTPEGITVVGWSADGRDLLFVGQADASPVRSLYAVDPQGGTPRLLIAGLDEGFDVASER